VSSGTLPASADPALKIRARAYTGTAFDLTRVGGKATARVIKDDVMQGGFREVEFDFVADNSGPRLLHCHQQLHMDFGFMALVNYA
jgi:FtsP/CotA-like multicopper oxidase with cupredoxin domain